MHGGWKVRLPPSGIASRAFTRRLSSACSIWFLSAVIAAILGCSEELSSIVFGKFCPTNAIIPSTRTFTSTDSKFAPVLFRPTASSCCTRAEPRRMVSLITVRLSSVSLLSLHQFLFERPSFIHVAQKPPIGLLQLPSTFGHHVFQPLLRSLLVVNIRACTHPLANAAVHVEKRRGLAHYVTPLLRRCM